MKDKNYVAVLTGLNGETNATVMDGVASLRHGSARCAEGDEYKAEVGAVIALCRAMGAGVASTCNAVLDAMKRRDEHYKNKGKSTIKVSKVKVTPPDMTGVQVGMARVGHGVLRTFAVDQRFMGRMGKETKFVDRRDKRLHVGDLVTVDKLVGEVRTGRKWDAVPGLHFVVDADDSEPESKGQFVMGLLTACNETTGKIDGKYRVKLVKTWKEVEFGETHDGIRVEWEDD